MPLVCIGLNHASAPLDVRGRLALAVPAAAERSFLEGLGDGRGVGFRLADEARRRGVLELLA